MNELLTMNESEERKTACKSGKNRNEGKNERTRERTKENKDGMMERKKK